MAGGRDTPPAAAAAAVAASSGFQSRDQELERAAKERDKLRQERKREREKAIRLENAGKKSKLARDAERDVSEKIALGMAVPRSATVSGEAAYDARLFNQSEGLSQGFGNDDDYNVYSSPLFNRNSNNRGGVYRPKSSGVEHLGSADDQIDRLKTSDRFVAEGSANDGNNNDAFASMLAGKAEARKVGSKVDAALTSGRRGAGTMAAAAGGGDPRVGSGRSRINFNTGS